MAVGSTQLRVTPQELKNARARLDSQIGQYVSWQAKFYNEVSSIQNRWQGEANRNFANKIEGFRKKLNELEQVLRQYSTFLESASGKYGTAESTIAGNASRLPN